MTDKPKHTISRLNIILDQFAVICSYYNLRSTSKHLMGCIGREIYRVELRFPEVGNDGFKTVYEGNSLDRAIEVYNEH